MKEIYQAADITQAEIALKVSKKNGMSNIQIYQKHGKKDWTELTV